MKLIDDINAMRKDYYLYEKTELPDKTVYIIHDVKQQVITSLENHLEMAVYHPEDWEHITAEELIDKHLLELTKQPGVCRIVFTSRAAVFRFIQGD